MGTFVTAMKSTAEGADQTRQAAAELARMAADLGRLVDCFHCGEIKGEEAPSVSPSARATAQANGRAKKKMGQQTVGAK